MEVKRRRQFSADFETEPKLTEKSLLSAQTTYHVIILRGLREILIDDLYPRDALELLP